MIQIKRLQQLAPLTIKMFRNFAVFKFPLPDLGEKIKEGTVKKLYVKQGDRVGEFDKIADVQSDKQFTEITAPEEGIIKRLHYKEDQTCQVGHVFLEIETNSTHSEPQPPKQQQKSKTEKVEAVQSILPEKSEVLASATVKMWAREHKINLQQVKGTGKKGRILKSDIINYLDNRKSQPIKAKILKEEVSVPPSKPTKTTMTQSEQLIQRLVTYSSSVPHLFLTECLDVTELTQIIESSSSKHHKISLLSLLVKSFSLALTLHPKINSVYSLSNQFGFKTSSDHNILLPRYTQFGLSFSVLQQAQNLSINGIQKQMKTEVDQDMSAQNIQNLISKSSVCLSYVGEIGGTAMNPLILGEMVSHISVGQVRSHAVIRHGKKEKRQLVNIVMGADHRVLDGATCARFTSTWKELSEHPKTAFLQMI